MGRNIQWSSSLDLGHDAVGDRACASAASTQYSLRLLADLGVPGWSQAGPRSPNVEGFVFKQKIWGRLGGTNIYGYMV